MHDAVFLFDVDGTLLQAGSRYHNRSLMAAVERLCGQMPDVAHLALAGRTDTEILADMAAGAGAKLTPDLPRLFQLAVEDFEVR